MRRRDTRQQRIDGVDSGKRTVVGEAGPGPSARAAPLHVVVDQQLAAVNLVPPCTTRWPTTSTSSAMGETSCRKEHGSKIPRWDVKIL